MQGTEEVRYGFTSREHDALTGLIYYRARSYDPLTGQVLQRDPIGFASGDLNLYAYVENDPYNWTDPSGLVNTADFTATSGRTAATGGWFSGIGNALLGLATGITSYMTGYTALDVVLNQADGGDGDGDGNDRRDDDGDQQPDNEPPDPNDVARELAAACAAQPFKCQEFANEFSNRLDEAGIDHEVLELRTDAGLIGSASSGEAISTTGVHDAVRVDGIVYDNTFPSGIPYGDWLEDLLVHSQPTITVRWCR